MGLFDTLRQQAEQQAASAPTTTARPPEGLHRFSTAARAAAPVDLTLGLPLMPHQEVVVEAIEAGYNALLVADEMGVGKTLSAIGSVEARGAYPCLVVCPPTLASNWKREIERAVPARTISVLSGTKRGPVPSTDYVIVPDSIVAAWSITPDPARRTIIPDGPLVAHPWAALVQDEAHRSKSEDAKRTQAVQHISKALRADALRLLLTGTPMLNRPNELVPLLNILGTLRPVFGGRSAFLSRYCQFDGWGKVIGAANSEELYQRLTGSVMIRRKRADVLDLPNKGRSIQTVTMSSASQRAYNRAERDLVDYLRDRKGDEKYDLSDRARAIVLLNALRRIAGEGKIDAAVELAEDLVSQGEQVFIGVWHTDVARAVADRLSKHGVSVLTGETPMHKRQQAVDTFQNGTNMVFVGNLEAAGVGITLTAARHYIGVELPWTPAAQQQVEDRLHRFGQKRDVTCTILTAEWDHGSVDERLWSLLDKKAKMISAILDGEAEGMDMNVQDELLSSYA